MPFALTLLARMEVDASCSWQFLCIDVDHFQLSGTVNTNCLSGTVNCRILDTENLPRVSAPVTETKCLRWFHRHMHSWTFIFQGDCMQCPRDLQCNEHQVQNVGNFCSNSFPKGQCLDLHARLSDFTHCIAVYSSV